MRQRMAGGLALALALPALIGMARAAETATPAPRTVTVELVDDRFVPDHLVFHHGVAYRLHLENRGKDQHEFTAPEFFKAVKVANPAALVADGHEAVLAPGQSRDIDFMPLRTGHFPLTCADHDWDGMVGTIDID
ncbi:MAG TPA: cupredoxin domain-containing protein [Candidatus Sulfotelmatobacter sp.]|nr:cupredoxin domain-containing protein [Candidatus Sulfotelmatobacter sp.]